MTEDDEGSGDLHVGDVVEAGTFLLLTSGEYSSFGVNGLYRAKQRFVIPGRPRRGWTAKPGELEVDVHALTTNPDLLEEIRYREIWLHE